VYCWCIADEIVQTQDDIDGLRRERPSVSTAFAPAHWELSVLLGQRILGQPARLPCHAMGNVSNVGGMVVGRVAGSHEGLVAFSGTVRFRLSKYGKSKSASGRIHATGQWRCRREK
jgi:hypothetical protein